VLTKPYGYLRKPASVYELRAAIEIALYKHSTDKGLAEREELHRDTISSISDTILITAEDGNFTYVSPNTHLIFGYSQEEVRKLGNVDRLLGREVYDPDALEKYGEIRNIEQRITDTSGQEHTLLVTVKRVSIKGGTVLYSCRDITDRKRAEDQVRSSLDEKEVLLRELHHRVKNNLAVMSSLLNLQARYVEEESHRHLFEDARTRIRSMAVAHELLYRAENLADLDIPEYLGRLADHLVVWTGSPGTAISLRKAIEPVSLGLDTAIPLGFILTELVTNSIKHAFPQWEEGEIRIALRALDDDEFELAVTDTGVGVPPDVDPNNPRSLGLSLINTFVNQLGGAFEVRTDTGTEARVRFIDASQSCAGEPALPVVPGASSV
jgi:PAS domain S-box-containing protein